MKNSHSAALVIAAAAGLLNAQAPRPAAKTAGETYKNVVVLRDIPQQSFVSAMAVISGALGVQCAYCHAQPYDSDAKATKLTARKMIKMTMEINAANFGGKQVVTCNTCHQGGQHPTSVSPVWDKTAQQLADFNRTQQRLAAPATSADAAHATSVPKSDSPTPAVEEIFEKYRKAVGMDHARSLHLEGFVTSDMMPRPRLIEFFALFPGRASFSMTTSGVSTKVLMNTGRAWVVTPRGAQEAPVEQVRGVTTLFSPVKLAESDAKWEVAGEEQLDGRPCYRVISTTADKTGSWYFDKQTGLLSEIRAENRTPIGSEPTRTIFDDYADVGGLKLPFSITQAVPTDRVAYRFSKIEANIEVDPAKFDVPTVKK